MKVRVLMSFVAIALVALGLWLTARRHAPAGRHPEVRIEDGKTIDFSSGKPVVKDNAAEKAKIQQGVSAIDAATVNVTFAPNPPPTPPAAEKK